MKKHFKIISTIVLVGLVIAINACKKDDNNPSPTGDTNSSVLSIKSSGITLEVGGTYALNTVWVDKNGNETAATGVTYNSSASGVASVSASGVVKGESAGATFITAQATRNGTNYTAKIPVSVTAKPQQGSQGPGSGLLPFVVAPGSVVWWANDPLKNLSFSWVYFGAGTLSGPTFESSNNSVVTVSSTGMMTFIGVGEAIVTVRASAAGNNFVQQIPVLVVGTPPAPLPIARIEVTPGLQKIFIDGEYTFTAKAYNSNNELVNNVNFFWEIEDADPDTIDGQIIKGATVDQTGKVKGTTPSVVKVKASAKGVSGSATVMVYPDAFYTISPFNRFVSPGQTVNLSAAYFEFNRSTFEPESRPWPAGSQWKTLNDIIGFPGFPLGSIGTLSAGSGNTATFNVSSNPLAVIPGMFEVIFVGQFTSNRIEPGVCILTVAP